MKEKTIYITEEKLKTIIQETIKPYKHLKLLTQDGDDMAALGTELTQEWLYENVNEGLIMSYDINKAAAYLKNKFANIKKIRSLRWNPYKRNETLKRNQFVAIDLGNDYSNYREIMQTIETLLGWFVSEIDVRVSTKGGFIDEIFHNFKGTFECYHLKLKGYEKYSGKDGFNNYLADNKVLQFSLIIEAKYGKRYKQKKGEIFYHATDLKNVKRIMKQGLVPRSEGNFPERIYLGKNKTAIIDMVGGNLVDMCFLEINADGLEIYVDEREKTAFYTYDNIPPEKIIKVYKQ